MATIEQFARASGFSRKHSGDFLHSESRKGRLAFCGNVAFGAGKAPKVYYITRRGWQYYTEDELLDLGTFVDTRPKAPWNRSLAHRLKTVSLTQAIGINLRRAGLGGIIEARFDFKTAPYLGATRKETTDFISSEISIHTALVPDAAFLVQRNDQRHGLIFLETDMGTEAITGVGPNTTIEEKFKKYERYYRSGRFQERYRDWGDFRSFIVFLITNKPKRVENIVKLLPTMEKDLDSLFLIGCDCDVDGSLNEPIWIQRGDKTLTRRRFIQ